MPEVSPDLISSDRARRREFVGQGTLFLFRLSLVLFLASLIVWAGFYFYHSSLKKNLASWEEQVKNQEAEFSSELFSQIVALANTMRGAGELLAGHPSNASLLKFMEEVTHPAVYFKTMQFSRESRKLDLDGVAQNFRTVAEQLSFFEGHNQVEDVSFGGLTRNEKGLVNFKMAIVVKPGLLKLRSK